MSFAFPFFLKNGVKKKQNYSADHHQSLNSAREQTYPTLASMIQSRASPDPSPTSSSHPHPAQTVTQIPSTQYPLEPEELEDNCFYQYIRSHFNQIFAHSTVVCVPHSRSLEGLVLTKDFIESHSFIASPYYQGQYQATNGKVISIEHIIISTMGGFREKRTVHVTAEELVYISNKKIRVFMIERPLEGEPIQQYRNPNTITIPTIRNSRADLEFLAFFPENNEALNELQITVGKFVSTYVYIRGFNTYTVDKIIHIYDKACKTISQKNNLFRDAISIQSEHDHFLELVENVVMGFLHEKIWIQSLRFFLQSQDTYIESLSKAYAKESITLRQYTVSYPIAEMPLSCFRKAIVCLRRVDLDVAPLPSLDDENVMPKDQPAFTPLEKLACVKSTLDLITAAVDRYVNSLSVDSTNNDSTVTTDELIPLLAYVLMHSRITRVASLAFYMEHFRLSHIKRSEHNFALVTLKASIEFLKGDPLSIMDACSNASTLSNTSTSSAILAPQLQTLRTRSTSFGTPQSPPPLQSQQLPTSSLSLSSSSADSPTQPNLHYRSVSLTTQHISEKASPTTTAPLTLPIYQHYQHHQIKHLQRIQQQPIQHHQQPRHPATARVLRHRKSQSADLQNIHQTKSVSESDSQFERSRHNSLAPNVLVRPPIVLPNLRENRKSLDIPNDWMMHTNHLGDTPTITPNSHSRPPSYAGPKHSTLGYTRPMVSTTFPSISNSTPLPALGYLDMSPPDKDETSCGIFSSRSDYTSNHTSGHGHGHGHGHSYSLNLDNNNNNNNISSSSSNSSNGSRHDHLPDAPRLARSLSTTSTMPRRFDTMNNQPPTIINIRDRVSFDSIKRPASICIDTRSMHSNGSGSQEDVGELMGDFLRGLQSMGGDIVGERSGKYRTFRD